MATISATTPNNSVAYINGRVYTINQAQPWAEAFIVSPKGTFTAVGSNAVVLDQAKAQNMLIHDLRNQFVMPGIHDAHLHLLMAGLSKLSGASLGLDNIIPHDQAAEAFKGAACMCSYAHAFGDWLYGDVFQIADYDRSCLDEAYPETPVLIRGGAGHSMYLNTAALKGSGYDIASEPPSKAAVLARRPDGSLTGEVAELGMTKAVLALPKPSLSHVKRALKFAFTRLHQSGITSCQDASSNTLLLHALRELEAENALKCNVYTHIVYAPEMLGEEPQANLHSLIDHAHEFSSKHVDTRFIKMMLDGVPLPPHFTHSGLDEHGQIDESKLFLDDVVEAVQKCDARGLTVKIHCSGQGATRRALDAFEAARKKNPNGPRHEVAHCSGVHDDDHPRFLPLNVTAELSPTMFFSHPLTLSSPELMSWSFPKHLSHKAHITIGSDWGVPDSPSPFAAMAGIVDVVGGGEGSRAVGDGDQAAITDQRAKGGAILCRLLTLNSAQAVGAQDRTGSIEVGKSADFIALSQDLSRGEFEGVKVLKTWFEGEIVWDAGAGV